MTSGSATRHPSLYLALRAQAWLRMSQSYDLSDVDTTLMLFAAATALSLGSELAERCFVDFSRGLLRLLRLSVSHARQLRFAPRTPAPIGKQLSHTPVLALVGYGGMYAGRGQMSSASSDDGAA